MSSRLQWGHLASRFFRALWPLSPCEADRQWVSGVLLPPELALWERFVPHDQRHTIGVARGVDELLTGTQYAGDSRWLAAALLHDVGKVEVGLSIPGRVVATLARGVWSRERVSLWEQRRGMRGRIGRYAGHGHLGGVLIRAAGGREEVAIWAECHHISIAADVPQIPAVVVKALIASDND